MALGRLIISALRARSVHIHCQSRCTTPVFLLTSNTVRSFGADTMATDATGLTEAQKEGIRKSWSLVTKDYKGHGSALFVKLFQTYPAYQNFFRDFRGVPLEDLKDTALLRAHGSTVLRNLGNMVDNLDDLECLVRLIKKQGFNHYAHGVRMQEFENLGPVVVGFLEERLGSHLTPDTKEAWGIMYKTLLTLIAAGQKEAVDALAAAAK